MILNELKKAILNELDTRVILKSEGSFKIFNRLAKGSGFTPEQFRDHKINESRERSKAYWDRIRS